MLRILASVEPEKENYGLEDIDFSSVEIGSEIPAYKVENGQLVNANIRLIPFFFNGEFVSLFYIANLPNGKIFVQLSNELVSTITENIDANPLAIICDDVGGQIYSDCELILLGKAETTTCFYEDTIRHNT